MKTDETQQHYVQREFLRHMKPLKDRIEEHMATLTGECAKKNETVVKSLASAEKPHSELPNKSMSKSHLDDLKRSYYNMAHDMDDSEIDSKMLKYMQERISPYFKIVDEVRKIDHC